MESSKQFPIYLLVLFLLAFMSSCSHSTDSNGGANNADQAAFEQADATVGAQLYNDLTKTPSWEGPSDPSITRDDIVPFKDFYRCKQCHGWDRKARFGAYINRNPKVSRPDVSVVTLEFTERANISELFDSIKNTGGAPVDPSRTADGTNPGLGGNEHPDYSMVFTDAQIWDLVKFLKEKTIDTDQLYQINTTGTYPTGSRTFTDVGRDGDAQNGRVIYSNSCAEGCHGANGTDIDLGGRSIGQFAREKSYELHHKVLSGQLGTRMGPTDLTDEEMKDLYKALANPTDFPDLN